MVAVPVGRPGKSREIVSAIGFLNTGRQAETIPTLASIVVQMVEISVP